MLDNAYSSLQRWKDLLPKQVAVIRKITVICMTYHEIPLRRLHGLKSVRVICMCNDRGHLKNIAEGQSIIDTLKETLGEDGLRFIVEDG